jgi:hypothetical protein
MAHILEMDVDETMLNTLLISFIASKRNTFHETSTTTEISTVKKMRSLSNNYNDDEDENNDIDYEIMKREKQKKFLNKKKNKESFFDTVNIEKKYFVDVKFSLQALLGHLTQLHKKTKSLKLDSDKTTSIGIVCNSIGIELICDLFLAHNLLLSKTCQKVIFHVPSYPLVDFSPTRDDIINHIQFISNPIHSDIWHVRHFGENLKRFVFEDAIEIHDDNFWCQETEFWNMPINIQEKIANYDLMFVKGDANYRRLFGECEWPLDTPVNNILNYWHVPMCALRTFKSDNNNEKNFFFGCGDDEKKK